MKNSIKRAQSQACLNFAERKNFRLQAKHKILMTLVALFTMTAGAWAQDTYKIDAVYTFTASGQSQSQDLSIDDAASLPFTKKISELDPYSSSWKENNLDATYITVSGDNIEKGTDASWDTEITINGAGTAVVSYAIQVPGYIDVGSATITFTVTKNEAAPDGPKVTWDAATKTGTFEMPAYDVEIAPIYAPKAVFATDGNLVLTPTAIEGIFAESTDAIVTAGTVAMIGETENPQGIVMYAVTSTNQATAPELSAFSATLPTAKDITVASEVLVWYYIKGADTPEGQEATAENTFNDSEICATPLTVTVLSNKYDINFKAANANTIQAGKATVKVGETAAEVDEKGNLTGVKMNSKVTVTAKDGYKFRKAKSVKLLTIGEVTLDITDCTTWQDVIGKNFPKIESSVGCVWTKGGSLILKNSSGNVSTEALVDPNATDYYWAADN